MGQQPVGRRAHADASNKVVAPHKNKSDIKTPAPIPAFDGVALRDLQLAETHGAAVDAHGDVVQWGAGFTDELDPKAPLVPQKTLVGMDIVKVQLCGPKVYALSRSGSIYVFAAERILQLTPGSWRDKLPGASATIDYVKLDTVADGRPTKERFVSIAAGKHHLLALSQRGTVWSVPVDEHANAYGQLGYSQTALNAAPESQRTQVEAIPWRLEPQILARKRQGAGSTTSLLDVPMGDLPEGRVWVAPSNIRFATQLRPIPSLRDVEIAQIAAGLEHSAARTPTGRVVGWGRNTYGQLALGESSFGDTIAVPTEVRWPHAVLGADTRCTDLVAGAHNTFFVMRSNGAPPAPKGDDDDAPPKPLVLKDRVDVLAAGWGERGSLGNALRSQVCSVPARVKNVSGLLEYSEQQHTVVPIGVRSLTVGPDGQCALVVDVNSLGEQNHRDVWVWGANDQYQLGNGKHSNLATPALLTLPLPGGEATTQKNGPTLNRLLLVERSKVPGKAYEADGSGSQRKYHIEQHIVAGGDGMAVYGRVVL